MSAPLQDNRLEHRRRALLARIHRRHPTVTEAVSVGHLKLEFTRIADPNRVLDEVAAAEDLKDRLEGRRDSDQLHLPYWAELWDSALGVAQFLVGATLVSPSASVLDLGCGMGLCGSVAAALGHRVLFADLEPEALLFARLNSLPNSDRVRTHRLNWRSDRLDESFDLIIGADILYERAQWEHLDAFWKSHLKDQGEIILGEPGRQTGHLFVDWVKQRSWVLDETAQPVHTRSNPIRIFRLKRKRESTACKTVL